VQPVRVVAAGGQQLRGGLDTDAVDREQVGPGLGDQCLQLSVPFADLGRQAAVADGQVTKGGLDALSRVGQVVAGTQAGARFGELAAFAAGQSLTQLGGGGNDQRMEFVDPGGTGLDCSCSHQVQHPRCTAP